MKYIPYEVKTGAENMQIDSDLLENAIAWQSNEPIFRLYGWSPACVSLGRNQKNDFIDEKFLKENNIDIVRRLTGGRALLHNDEITYSFVCPVSYLKHGENVVASYKEISQILIDAFKKLNIELDFGGKPKAHGNFCMLVSTGADLCYQGKKLIGSAQFRKSAFFVDCHSELVSESNNCNKIAERTSFVRNEVGNRTLAETYILQHGSILYDYDRELLEKVFNEKVDTSSITSIKEINPDLTKEDIIKVLRNVN